MKTEILKKLKAQRKDLNRRIRIKDLNRRTRIEELEQALGEAEQNYAYTKQINGELRMQLQAALLKIQDMITVHEGIVNDR